MLGKVPAHAVGTVPFFAKEVVVLTQSRKVLSLNAAVAAGDSPRTGGLGHVVLDVSQLAFLVRFSEVFGRHFCHNGNL